MGGIIKYGSRTFSEYKEDLVAMIKETYPEIFRDFTDSSVGSLLIDLNAGIGNNLSMNLDRLFMETQLENSQKRSSILDHAKRLGFNIPGKRPSVTVVDLTVDVPVSGDQPDSSYYPTLLPGAVITGGGKSFETQDTIDWKSPVNSLGDPNRMIIPNLDNNGIIVSYSVTKREVVVNGTTKIHKKVIGTSDVKPFFSITLPDDNVISVENVILLSGTNFSSPPSTPIFFDNEIRYYEVDYLAQQRIFLEKQIDLSNDHGQGLKAGRWENVTQKFIKEYTPNGYCRLIFGSGDPKNNQTKEYLKEGGVNNQAFIDNYLNNTALGERLKSGHTLFIRYRVGGGSGSNLGKNVLTGLGTFNMVVNGSRLDENQKVRRSLRATNPIPAVGGNDGLSIEQIRHLIKYNLSSQNRCVTLNDYLLQLFKMPGRFGLPFKATVYKVDNKVIISILGIDSTGKLSSVSNSLLKQNIMEYMTEHRMINDFVEVMDGRIYNLAFDVDVFVEDIADTRIANNIIREISEYFNVRKNEMNRDVFMGDLERKILDIPGIINIINVKAYNRVGKGYSNNSMSLDLVNENTDQLTIPNNTIYSSQDSMFEIKYPEKDIRVFLRKRNV